MPTISINLESVDATLLVRYLNAAIAKSEEHLEFVLSHPDVFAEHPVWESNARFDLEHSKRLKTIVETQRDEADRLWFA